MNTIWKYAGADYTEKRHEWRCDRCGHEYVEVMDAAPSRYEIKERYDGGVQPKVVCIPCKNGAHALGEGGLEWLERVIERAISGAFDKARINR